VLSCGLFAGAAVYITLVEHPARMECGTELAATEFRPSYRRAAVMQACRTPLGGLLGGILLVAVIPFTLLAVRPTNTQLLTVGTACRAQHIEHIFARGFFEFAHPKIILAGLGFPRV